MDMKTLKKNMWDLLTDGRGKETVAAEVSAGGPDPSIALMAREWSAGN